MKMNKMRGLQSGEGENMYKFIKYNILKCQNAGMHSFDKCKHLIYT